MRCSIDDCRNEQKYGKLGWCQTHYHRWWRTGDPQGVKQQRGASGADAVSWKGDDVTYYGAHGRVKRTRGSAKRHQCAMCQKPAQQWAYAHTDPNPKWATFPDRGTVPYSSNPQHYSPLCKSCHVKLDRGRNGGWSRRTHCKRGHVFDEANTYARPNGERSCRTCARQKRKVAP